VGSGMIFVYSLRIFSAVRSMFISSEDVSWWKFEEANVARRVNPLAPEFPFKF